MPKLVINLSSHPQPTTVSQMRKRLAQVLSKLNGDQEVSFNFIATLENYQPAVTGDFYEDRAKKLGISRETAKALSVGLGYTFGQDPGTAEQMAYYDEPTVFGELARPENE